MDDLEKIASDLAAAEGLGSLGAILKRLLELRLRLHQQRIEAPIWNRSVLLRLLLERRIGLEIAKLRKDQVLMKRGETKKRTRKNTLSDYGLRRIKGTAFLFLSKIDENKIRKFVDDAERTGRRASYTKFMIQLKAEGRRPIAGKGPVLIHDSDDTTVLHVIHLVANLANINIEPATVWRKMPPQFRHNFSSGLPRAAEFIARLYAEQRQQVESEQTTAVV